MYVTISEIILNHKETLLMEMVGLKKGNLLYGNESNWYRYDMAFTEVIDTLLGRIGVDGFWSV